MSHLRRDLDTFRRRLGLCFQGVPGRMSATNSNSILRALYESQIWTSCPLVATTSASHAISIQYTPVQFCFAGKDLSFVFTNVDPNDHARQFAFGVAVQEGQVYAGKACQKHLALFPLLCSSPCCHQQDALTACMHAMQ